ncbi:hypothetical protein NC99_26120 [Sunxiuqinia dokdonensis]|uniref:Uncharacterized protein n=1 Tax=Sunxiuqinia dokdonensis TaxID=1409788 RepID=A0A0L8V8W0_9BACT|nr:hypothetical protein NC99_26120 [Sunxiuqinia dokdonensis]
MLAKKKIVLIFTQIPVKVISLPGTVKGNSLFVARFLRMRSAFPFHIAHAIRTENLTCTPLT